MMRHAICKVVGLYTEVGQLTPPVCGWKIFLFVEVLNVLEVDGVETVGANATEDGKEVGVLSTFI